MVFKQKVIYLILLINSILNDNILVLNWRKIERSGDGGIENNKKHF